MKRSLTWILFIVLLTLFLFSVVQALVLGLPLHKWVIIVAVLGGTFVAGLIIRRWRARPANAMVPVQEELEPLKLEDLEPRARSAPQSPLRTETRVEPIGRPAIFPPRGGNAADEDALNRILRPRGVESPLPAAAGDGLDNRGDAGIPAFFRRRQPTPGGTNST